MSNRRTILLALLCFMLAVFAVVRDARADALTAVAAPAQGTGAEWLGALVFFGLLAIVGAGVWFRHKYPSQAAQADTALKHRIAEALEALAAKGAPVITPIDVKPDAPTLTEAVPAGKQGQAGPLTIQCTGDAKTDSAAWQQAYFD